MLQSPRHYVRSEKTEAESFKCESNQINPKQMYSELNTSTDHKKIVVSYCVFKYIV